MSGFYSFCVCKAHLACFSVERSAFMFRVWWLAIRGPGGSALFCACGDLCCVSNGISVLCSLVFVGMCLCCVIFLSPLSYCSVLIVFRCWRNWTAARKISLYVMDV